MFVAESIRRKDALKWWNSLSYMEKVDWSLKTTQLRSHPNMPITGREIEQIYSFKTN